MIFALVRIWLNDKILTKEDLEKESSIPIVGMVGNKTNGNNLITLNNPRGSVVEDFRSIKLNLPYVQPSKVVKTICVTSSAPGEGKTFCSVNLASVYALSGKKTLVLFADLRRPRIDKELEILNEKGLSNVLAGTEELLSCIQESSVKNLFVLPSGPTPPNPAELLGLEKMDEIMAQLKEIYYVIIIDTPPLGLVADSLILLKYSDVVCYIVRHNYTRKVFLRKINEMYEDAKIKNICLVINDIVGDTVRYGYGYGYRYGSYGYQNGYFDEEILPFWKKIKKRLFQKTS
jgi:capsular exopolysaccharide synthesis family protein